jgi:hypothetical protein
MKQHQPSGLRGGLELFIDSNWSADQALAVIELLDDLRDRVWGHYELTLKTAYREDRVTRHEVCVADPPF